MFQEKDGLPFKTYMDHFLQEMVLADAQAQILQQTGWIEFKKSIKKKEGIDITEGLGQMEYLGLRDITLSFCVEPVQPGLWQRIKRLIRYLFGRQEAPAQQICRLVPHHERVKSSFMVSLTVGRSKDGAYTLKTEPESNRLGGVYVSGILT